MRSDANCALCNLIRFAERAVEREYAAALDENRTTRRACRLLGARGAEGCRRCPHDRRGNRARPFRCKETAAAISRPTARRRCKNTKSRRLNRHCANPSWEPPGLIFMEAMLSALRQVFPDIPLPGIFRINFGASVLMRGTASSRRSRRSIRSFPKLPRERHPAIPHLNPVGSKSA